jgi:hypothetical protein
VRLGWFLLQPEVVRRAASGERLHGGNRLGPSTKLAVALRLVANFDDTRATVSSRLHPPDMKLHGSGWQPYLELCGPRGIRGRMPWGPLQPLNDILCGPFGRTTIKANDDAGFEVSAAAPIEDPPPPGNPGSARVLPDLHAV